MIKVRMKDLALVALAGGLLAFEWVSLGEALPRVKQALAGRGLLGKAAAAPAGAAGAASSAIVQAGSTASHAALGAVKGVAHVVAAAADPGASNRRVWVTRVSEPRRVHQCLRFVTVTSDGTGALHTLAPTPEQVRELKRVVERAMKEATL